MSQAVFIPVKQYWALPPKVRRPRWPPSVYCLRESSLLVWRRRDERQSGLPLADSTGYQVGPNNEK